MDASQTAFDSQYPAEAFDIDMMKRSMETVTGPDAKKARWSPSPSPSSTNDAFSNYGYGPNASINQPQNNGNGGQSFPTGIPQLTINTNTSAAANNGQQPSPNSAMFGGPSPSAPSPYNAFGAYGMLGLGLPGMLGFPYNQIPGFGANFQQNQAGLPSLTIPSSPGGYSAQALQAASAALSASASIAQNRTVYIGNLPATASVDELLNLIHFGPIENVRVLPEKSCVFISFLDGATAAAFHADATIKKLTLHGQELKIGWGKPSPVPSQVQLAISQSNASRNVYVGGLDENMTEEQLRDELSRFGLIDQVKIVRDKNIGFVHFLAISVATKVVNTLPTEPNWAGKRVNYGKDRCAYVPKSQQAAAQQAQAAAAQSLMAQAASPTMASPLTAGPNGFQSPFSAFPYSPVDAMLGGASANRTVYIGNIHPETTTEDLCNSIRGGVLQIIRYMQEKHIAFVTFIDPAAAFTFFQVASYQGMTINNRRLKIGWGKNSGPLPTALALAVHAGATRNVYIGNIEDFETFSEERLKRDFTEYGEIELVNFLKEKNCAFVNYTNIANAIKAIESIKNKPEYANLRIAHGKDRCANAPRSGPQGASGGRKSSSRKNTAKSPTSAVDGDGDMEGIEESGSPIPDEDIAKMDAEVAAAGV
ncbi:hypothetical protein CYLTODRAFT_494356 [Cylindrobasidium torrendii FP15055 ss-10]|uniref:RRM domain-containing protein n=1 Tax=Cylindrobasidium torrendii FP15055 ss-10 TaxID=1314674 RepID=A0A0D7AY78_9AGAR|nr:hypothetical protein CYLTODRAFT_494356 [Cylindrobasidium torrendii FP15055 ss-10]